MSAYVNVRPGDIDLLSVITRVDIVHVTRGVQKCFTNAGVISMAVFAHW